MEHWSELACQFLSSTVGVSGSHRNCPEESWTTSNHVGKGCECLAWERKATTQYVPSFHLPATLHYSQVFLHRLREGSGRRGKSNPMQHFLLQIHSGCFKQRVQLTIKNTPPEGSYCAFVSWKNNQPSLVKINSSD